MRVDGKCRKQPYTAGRQREQAGKVSSPESKSQREQSRGKPPTQRPITLVQNGTHRWHLLVFDRALVRANTECCFWRFDESSLRFADHLQQLIRAVNPSRQSVDPQHSSTQSKHSVKTLRGATSYCQVVECFTCSTNSSVCEPPSRLKSIGATSAKWS